MIIVGGGGGVVEGSATFWDEATSKKQRSNSLHLCFPSIEPPPQEHGQMKYIPHTLECIDTVCSQDNSILLCNVNQPDHL